ncbi:MAG: chorismate synthase [Coriobacteriales bacterium]|nr:chorismate synthase [Coriobacteriales bacterium]
MGSTFGNTLRVSIFGQSHSPATGCVIEGLPSGVTVDMARLQHFMDRRAPGRTPWSTPRKEADEPRIVSGLNAAGQTCGTPLCAIIENANTRSGDYATISRIPRPGHADFAAWAKWGQAHDIAGGGHFSARLTAPLCVAGGIALQLLEERGVHVAAHVLQVGDVRDDRFAARDMDAAAQQRLAGQMRRLHQLPTDAFPVLDEDAGQEMMSLIDRIRRDQDSVGGAVECVATGLPAGVGGPRYDGVQGAIARIVFGIPAVKGLEFGAGFEVAGLRGSQNNDCLELRDGQVLPSSNFAGGTLGGISTGAPVLFAMAVKPTPSIARPQQSVDLTSMEPATLEVRGRHDPCVAARAVPIAEAAMALALLDSWLSYPPTDWRA